MKDFLHDYPPAAAAIYAVLGIILFVICFRVIDWATPGNLWKEIIENKNMAAAIVVAATLLGVSIIIASSIVG